MPPAPPTPGPVPPVRPTPEPVPPVPPDEPPLPEPVEPTVPPVPEPPVPEPPVPEPVEPRPVPEPAVPEPVEPTAPAAPERPVPPAPPVPPGEPPVPEPVPSPAPAPDPSATTPAAPVEPSAAAEKATEAPDEEPPAGMRTVEEPPVRKRRLIERPAFLGVLTVVVVLLAVAAFVVGRIANESASTTTTTPSASSTTVPPNFVTFDDPGAGISVKYPKEWERVAEGRGSLRLAVAPGAGSLDAVTVQVFPIEVAFTNETEEDFNAYTDAIVTSEEGVKVLTEREITINGSNGYYYLYTFEDAESGLTGVHAHYFLFRGKKMHTLVFQALPQEGFPRMAQTFDIIAGSFTTDPSVPAPSAPTVTTGR